MVIYKVHTFFNFQRQYINLLRLLFKFLIFVLCTPIFQNIKIIITNSRYPFNTLAASAYGSTVPCPSMTERPAMSPVGQPRKKLRHDRAATIPRHTITIRTQPVRPRLRRRVIMPPASVPATVVISLSMPGIKVYENVLTCI